MTALYKSKETSKEVFKQRAPDAFKKLEKDFTKLGMEWKFELVLELAGNFCSFKT